MATDRTMSTTWHGTLMDGAGTIHEAGSGAFGPLEVSWASRAEAPNGKTSPRSSSPLPTRRASRWRSHTRLRRPERRPISSTLGHRHVRPGRGITKIALTVRGSVPGIDAEGFVAAAEGAKVGCPVSKALAGVPEITLDAALA